MKKFLLFCTAIIISSNSLFAQLPNGGFETWTTTSGYDVPTGWDQLNAMTSSMSTYTCMKGTPGSPGTSYIKLVSKTVGSMGVMPGISCSGMLDQSVMTNIVAKSGFPNTTRPANLTGSWQYMASGSDQGHISILLTKWNSSMSKRDTVAYTNKLLSGMAMSWASFTIPMTYMTGAVPDSAIILLSASGTTPVNGSYLYVDNLAFSGTVPAGVANVDNNTSAATVYPNPANGTATISYSSSSEKEISIFVSDINGKNLLLLTPKAVTGSNRFPLNISGFAKGVYLIKIMDGSDAPAQQLIIE